MSNRRSRPTHPGRVTLSQIAARVGTSAITVSRVLNTPHLVSDDLRKRIECVIAELSYLPNRAARALASARSDSIAVLIPSVSNNVFADLLEGVRSVFHARGYRLLIGDTRYSPQEEENLLRAFLGHAPDGVLLAGHEQTETSRHMLERNGIPVVHMLDLPDAATYSVGMRQADAGRAITRHLIERGYKRIGFLGVRADSRAMQRHAGYVAALEQAGLRCMEGEVFDNAASSIGLGCTLVVRLLAQMPDCDAVFCCNDEIAQGVLFECQRRGITVPGRLAVAGFNDLDAAAWSYPRLTTVATPRYQVGQAAAGMLLQLMKGEVPEKNRIDLGFSLVLRESS
jgi:LacI family gluconate utilization system Gnt-I transcriptional repressor